MPKIQWVSEPSDGHVPKSLSDLRDMATQFEISEDELCQSTNWTELLDKREVPQGWVQLGDIAKTGRGIATGCNDFFLVSAEQAEKIGFQSINLIPCIGKSMHVERMIFKSVDFDNLNNSGKRVFLFRLHDELNEREELYVSRGEKDKVHERYLLKIRTPWYSMESKPVFPIWVSVFKRGGARFVRNRAGIYSLTNFHGILPHDDRAEMHDALSAVLNYSPVLEISSKASRKFGGGLAKFEPKDLRKIWLPDLRNANLEVLKELAAALEMFDEQFDSINSRDKFDERVSQILLKI